MKPGLFLLKFLLPAVFIIAMNNSNAQVKQDSLANQDLYGEIAYMDSILFNAFNTRNIEQFKSFFTTDLEFFHDKEGLTNYDHTIEFMKSVSEQNNQLRRDIVKGSLEVYPVPGYGAMEIGTHTFCHMENGRQECGTFKFIHIWQKKNNKWKISRIISYDH
ncbi:MAG TPA: nuclear transport factor 2 family protein [Chitinophagaceae bacterium]